MKTFLQITFWSFLAGVIVYSLYASFQTEPPSAQSLYDLKSGYEQSYEDFHKQQLISQMCEISGKMRPEDVPNDIKDFLQGSCK